MRIVNALMKYRYMLLAGTMLSAVALPHLGAADTHTGFNAASSDGRIILAEAVDPKQGKQPQKKETPKKTAPPKADAKPKAPPKQTGQPKPDPKPKVVQPKPDPKPKAPPKQTGKPKVDPKAKTVQPKQPAQPKADPKAVQQPKPDPKAVQPKVVDPKVVPPPKGPVQQFGKPKAAPGPKTVNVNQVKAERKETKEGNAVVIREPGNRTIIRENNTVIIQRDESDRMRRWGGARFEVRGPERYTVVGRGGYEVVTITDDRGRLLRRFQRWPGGREVLLIDNRPRPGVVLGVGAVVVGGIALLTLARPVVTIPRERYVVNVAAAPPTLLYETLAAPPVVALERPYTLDEVRYNVALRERVRSVELDNINFETGSWEVSDDQVPKLQEIAQAMLQVIEQNPSKVIMIEGHTDAVGATEDNLSLSDRRAELVGEALTTHFNVPPENLVTQGYGEQFLKVPTQGPNRENRRVVVRDISTLLAGK